MCRGTRMFQNKTWHCTHIEEWGSVRMYLQEIFPRIIAYIHTHTYKCSINKTWHCTRIEVWGA